MTGPRCCAAAPCDVLDRYHAFHATRANLLRRLERSSDAREAHDQTISLASNPAERADLSGAATSSPGEASQ